MASVTNVHINPLDFTLVNLALLSLVRSAAISMSVSQSSGLVESCSLKTAISLLSTGLYHSGVVPLLGLSSQHQCKGVEWVSPLIRYNSGSPSVKEQ